VNRQMVVKVLKTIGIWIPTLMLVWVFTMQGFSKFDDTSGWSAAFRAWGYPDWFRITIGAVEMLAAALLLWVRSAPLGAMLIICVMLGGMATHVLHDQVRHVRSEVVPLTFATIVLIARRRYLAELLARAASLRQGV
jgi:putative oxidoreductase